MQKKEDQQILAGVRPTDSNIEFVGIRSVKKVLWIQNGVSRYFKDLPANYFNILKECYLQDPQAVADLCDLGSVERQVELYTYFMYGDLDNEPDIKKGQLAPSENFRDGKDCICQKWKSKTITIDGEALKPRDIIILDAISQDLPDKAIANILGIAMSTFNIHKKDLLTRTNCATKTALALKAMNQNVISA